MQALLILLLFEFMVCPTKVEGIPGSEYPSLNYLFSNEAKAIAETLHKYINNIDRGIVEFSNQLRNQNYFMTVLERYSKVYKRSKGTSCYEEKLPIGNGQELIDTFLEDCVKSQPKNDREAFDKKIKYANDKVKVIDENLRENDASCKSNLLSCTWTKMRLSRELKYALSPKQMEDYKKEADHVLNTVNKYLERCLKEDIDDCLEVVKSTTTQIKECLWKLE